MKEDWSGRGCTASKRRAILGGLIIQLFMYFYICCILAMKILENQILK